MKIDEEKLAVAIEMYQSGGTASRSALEAGISEWKFRKILRERGKHLNGPGRRDQDLSSFMRMDTEEHFYWLGFIFANITVSGRTGLLSVRLKRSKYLRDLKTFLGLKNSVCAPHKGRVSLYVCGQEFLDWLKMLGCVEGLFNRTVPSIGSPENEKAFGRGVFDACVRADGSITIPENLFSPVQNVLYGLSYTLVENNKPYIGIKLGDHNGAS